MLSLFNNRCFLFEGPKLPKKLVGHSSVTQGSNLIVIGGAIFGGDYSSDLYKLTVNNNQYRWSEMDVKLKNPRRNFVASLIPY